MKKNSQAEETERTKALRWCQECLSNSKGACQIWLGQSDREITDEGREVLLTDWVGLCGTLGGTLENGVGGGCGE